MVVIDSMRIESDWDANDESGVYLTDRIIIRRSFGVNELELELLLK